MSLPVLQFVGMPGGPELLVIGLIFLLLFGVPLAIVVVVGVLWLRSREGGADRERVAELEREVEALREQLEATTDEDAQPSAPGPDSDSNDE